MYFLNDILSQHINLMNSISENEILDYLHSKPKIFIKKR